MEIDIKEYKLFCDKGSSKFNEDVVGINKYVAWILDGSTGLNNKNLISDESDAKWYVTWWDKYLQNNLYKNTSIRNIVLEGMKTIKSEYFSSIKESKIGKLDMPSASIAIVKFHKYKLEYFILGDCTLIMKNDENIIVKDERVCKYDDIIFEKMSKLNQKKSLTVKEKKNILLPYIIENRLKKNTEEGYWILEFDENAVEKSINEYIDISDELKIIMSSDGFSCAFDRYEIFETEEIMTIVKDKGIEHINEKIRQLEKEDKQGIIFPRFKENDDSSCIYLHIIKRQKG